MTSSIDPVRIRKDGNSLVITIPTELLSELDWDQGDLVTQTVEQDRLTVRRAEIRRDTA